jgi:hypothetical protein
VLEHDRSVSGRVLITSRKAETVGVPCRAMHRFSRIFMCHMTPAFAISVALSTSRSDAGPVRTTARHAPKLTLHHAIRAGHDLYPQRQPRCTRPAPAGRGPPAAMSPPSSFRLVASSSRPYISTQTQPAPLCPPERTAAASCADLRGSKAS